jgi:acyl-CoA synthetase (AMP-forming)/AMP-acid ligase II
MASDLDRRIATVVQLITARGAPFETGLVERDGIGLPAFVRAPASLPDLFERYCTQHAASEFLVDGDIRLSFAETHALARRVAVGLVTRHGLRRGDRVGIAARNSANWIIAYMGVLMAGGCVALLNGWWAAEELGAGVALADCALVLADPARAVRLEHVEHAARLAVIGHGAPETGLTALLASAGDGRELPRIGGDDLATIMFTSGSTGTAKGAVSDHRAVVQATINFAVQALTAFMMGAAEGELPPPQSTLLSVPLFHVTGEIALFLQSFVTGRRLVVMPRWDAREAMRLIECERITFFAGVPLMSLEIANHPDRARYDLSSCTAFGAGGAPRPAAHVARLDEALPHASLVMGYGLTETNCVGSCNFGDNYLAKPGSTGPASRPLVEIAVFGPEGRPLPAGVRGEVAVRSICNFRGYWDNPEETAAALRPDGFFLTGDLGYLDEDGYLFVVDRKKDIIIRGGENIASAEVEQAIYTHPGVAEASVFGLPDALYGEVPVAVYAIKHGHRLHEDELRRHLESRIAAFKVPVRLWRADDALPRLGTEKIDKRALKARYSQGWEDARSAS